MGNDMDNNEQKDYYEFNNNSQPGMFTNANGSYHVPTWAIVVGFFLNWLLGVGLLVARLCEDKTPRRASSAAAKKPKKNKFNAGILLIIFGAVALIAGIGNMPDAVQYLIWCIEEGSHISYGIEDVFKDALWIISGLVLLIVGRKLQKGARWRSKIVAVVGNAKYMYVEEISKALSISKEKTVKYLHQCIDSGMFGDSAYLDMRSESLVVSGPAPEAKKPKQTEEVRKEENLNKYDSILKELRDINESIPGEEMSAKIDRLEDLTAKIFKLLQEHPEKQSKMNKFMDYYLPTSLKLLKRYAQLDAQEVEGANITKSKKQIEETMDTMVTAFEKQLDKMFYAESIDISADIAAMQNMMHADGLTQNDLFDDVDNAGDANDVDG